jgi:hypothetical protein
VFLLPLPFRHYPINLQVEHEVLPVHPLFLVEFFSFLCSVLQTTVWFFFSFGHCNACPSWIYGFTILCVIINTFLKIYTFIWSYIIIVESPMAYALIVYCIFLIAPYLRHYEHRLLCWETCCCYIVCIFFILWYPHTCDNSNTIVCRGLCWYYIAFW